jgi:hypothetical protein
MFSRRLLGSSTLLVSDKLWSAMQILDSDMYLIEGGSGRG